MNKELKLLLSLIIVIGGIIFLFKYPQYVDSQDLKRENKNCLDEIENQYFGIVDSTVDGKLDYFFFKKSLTKHYLRGHSAWYKLKKGDSIVKRKGESRYIIYKKGIKNDSVILNFECKTRKDNK
jgi:hypothetical protein